MNIVIAGAGAVGTHLAKMLSRQEHNIMLIDTNQDKLEDLEKQIRSFDEEKNRARIMEHHRKMGSYESGHACEAVCSWIKQKSICEENA